MRNLLERAWVWLNEQRTSRLLLTDSKLEVRPARQRTLARGARQRTPVPHLRPEPEPVMAGPSRDHVNRVPAMAVEPRRAPQGRRHLINFDDDLDKFHPGMARIGTKRD